MMHHTDLGVDLLAFEGRGGFEDGGGGGVNVSDSPARQNCLIVSDLFFF